VGHYRAYLVGKNGQILDRLEFNAADDQDALGIAGAQADKGDVEVWLQDRLVGTVKQPQRGQ